jgi:preprotein translocase subunit SecG
MGILGTVLLVVFIIVAILLVLLVLVQNEEGDSLGGIFAGGSSSAFGSRSGNVLTKATSVLGTLFLILSLGLALVNKSSNGSGVEAAGRQLSTQDGGTTWVDEAINSTTDASVIQTPPAPDETQTPVVSDETSVDSDETPVDTDN